jgi:hypothetical protein
VINLEVAESVARIQMTRMILILDSDGPAMQVHPTAHKVLQAAAVVNRYINEL